MPVACRLSASEAYASAKASAYNVSEGGLSRYALLPLRRASSIVRLITSYR